MNQKMEIIIDELVLHGFNPADRHIIGESLSVELERLLGYPNFQTGNVELDSIDAGQITLLPRSRPETVGAQVGRAIFMGMAEKTKVKTQEKRIT